MTELATGRNELTAEQTDHLLHAIAEGFAHRDRERAPILHTPAEAGLEYENVTFPAMDGVPLEGWFIPAKGSSRLLVLNHPMGFSRSGQPTHLEPWRSEWGTIAGGVNAVEVNFVPDLKILHDAGYNLLTYDLRNHGLSGSANGGIVASGWLEARDVVGSLRYVRGRQDLRQMSVGLYSRCLGCNSTFAAMTQFPEEFQDVQCLVGAQPISTDLVVRHQLALAGVAADRLDEAMADLDQRVTLTTSLGFSARNTQEWAKHVQVPTLLYGVHDDVLTEPHDLETMLANIQADDKELYWVRDSLARWDGYLEFQRHPAQVLSWFAQHLA